MSCISLNLIKAMYHEMSISCLCDNILAKENKNDKDYAEISPETQEFGVLFFITEKAAEKYLVGIMF